MDLEGVAQIGGRVGEAPVAVVGEIHQRGRVGLGVEGEAEGLVFDVPMGGDPAGAGEAAVAVGEGELQRGVGRAGVGDLPDLRVGRCTSAVERVLAVVMGVELVGGAVDGGAGVADAVADGADDAAAGAHFVFISAKVGAADGEGVGDAGQADVLKGATVGQDRGGKIAAGDRDAVHVLAFGGLAEEVCSGGHLSVQCTPAGGISAPS